ncbi:uroporphyrinogen-III C-methyltransferase [Stenotrophomonas sp. NLF4-10]|uniref:uroporphyrinogen-III C-methyltransferase n=1 Tax=Stenotrophomonas sp. NLF4-10 TaxID=2918754 RepID=UPI001EFB9572|nr:uroporphyrinogen-III C-methyltransferase [Stenotrophomonas sp. NLF4-10]MCG8275241.1 uroporphyrinogen-III C-methyltransferase [Stenotrophomonas sp. NLF4-10]
MNDDSPTPPRRLPLRWLAAVLVVLAATAAGWFFWHGWQAEQRQDEQARATAARQLADLQKTVEDLRRDQRATARGVQDAASTNRVLRDEMLGLGQRSALLEENLARLADNSREGTQAVRREEAELLLVQARQRLVYAADLDGARRLYALAAGVMEDLDGPRYLNLRQALMQERNALDALGPGVRARSAEQLTQWAAALDTLPEQPQAAAADKQPWWQQMLSPLVQIRPADPQVLAARSERIAAHDALQIELSLARAALERGDAGAWQQALQRMDAWLLRLWPDTPQRQRQRQLLDELGKADLQITAPELGSTLQQLRGMREAKEAP